jgi:hypothetical protein
VPGRIDARAHDVTWSLVEAAGVVGGYVWLEERLFETLGAWVPSVAEPEVKLHVAADSHHHAWHASLWRPLLPALAEMDGEQFVAPRGPGVGALVTALQPSASPTTIDKVVGLYRVVLPRLVTRYQRHLATASSVTDGPTIRALQLVVADELADWRRGEALVQGLLMSPEAVRSASEAQARLETLLIEGGCDGG